MYVSTNHIENRMVSTFSDYLVRQCLAFRCSKYTLKLLFFKRTFFLRINVYLHITNLDDILVVSMIQLLMCLFYSHNLLTSFN